jgi:hypothetical protein
MQQRIWLLLLRHMLHASWLRLPSYNRHFQLLAQLERIAWLFGEGL